jgi:hypothetical protein
MENIFISPTQDIVKGKFEEVKEFTEQKCVGNACANISWRFSENKEIAVFNSGNKSVSVKFSYASIYGNCSNDRTVTVFPYETFKFFMPPQYLGVCLPIEANFE